MASRKLLTSSTPAVMKPSATFGISSDTSAPSTITESTYEGSYEVVAKPPVPKKLSTLDLVLEAIGTIGVPRKGASYLAIQKWIASSEEIVANNRLKANLKKAIIKALESGLLKRPTISKNVTGLRGYFIVDKDAIVQKKKDKVKTAKKIVEKAKATKVAKAKTAAVPDTKAAAASNTKEVVIPKNKAAAGAKTKTAAAPKAKAAVASKAAAGAKTKTAAAPKAKAAVAPKTTAAAAPKTKAITAPKTKAAASSKTKDAAAPKTKNASKTKPEAAQNVKPLGAPKTKTVATMKTKHVAETETSKATQNSKVSKTKEDDAEPGLSNKPKLKAAVKPRPGKSPIPKSKPKPTAGKRKPEKDEPKETPQEKMPQENGAKFQPEEDLPHLVAKKAVSKPTKKMKESRPRKLYNADSSIHIARKDLSDTELNVKPDHRKSMKSYASDTELEVTYNRKKAKVPKVLKKLDVKKHAQKETSKTDPSLANVKKRKGKNPTADVSI